MASIVDYDRSALDRSLNPALDFMASHPVYRDIGVKSGRRSKASNRKAGGDKKSQHLLGKALDLDVSRLSNAQKAQLLSDLASYGIKGVGIYDNNNIHIDARKNFATWGPSPKGKYAGVEISQQPKWARQALTAIQQAGPYKAFPAAPAAVPGTASLATGPAGTSLADAYRTAQYQRAMPEGPTPPATAPVPASRPLDSIGGLGAAYRQAAQTVRGTGVAPSAPVAPAGERFGYPASPASAPAMTSDQRIAAERTLSDMLAGRNMPVSPAPATRSLSPASVESPQLSQQKRDMQAAYDRQIGQSQRFRPSAAPAPAPAPAPAQAQTRSIAAPAPSVPSFADNQVVDAANQRVAAATTMNNMMTGQNMPVGPAQAPPAALAAARNLGTATAAQQIAPPAAMDAAKKLGNAIAAQQINAPAAIPPDVRQTAAYASMPPGTPAALAEKVSQPAPQQVAAAPQAAQQRPAGGLPTGVAGPWGADIANQQPSLDRMTTQSTAKVADPAHPPGFMGKLGDFAQRYGPQIAGTLIAGPVGGLLGGLLGRSFDAAKPGQVLGNPFQGLANTARAMGMFQSGTPYAGPVSTYGYGTRAIGDVLGGNAPVGSRAYSRSTPGYHVTSLPNGMVQKTNQYGFTSFERPSMGPTASSFPGGFSSAPGGVFSGGGFFGGWGGGGQSSGKTSGGRTSGGKSGSGKSGGGRKSERSESAGY